MAAEETENRRRKLRRNLLDAGCSAHLAEQFLALEQAQKRREQYRLLSRQKAALLTALHQTQYKIDCLDHLVYTMQSEDKK